MAHTEERKQFAAEVCPMVEETYFCVEKFHPHDQCVEDLLNGQQAKNCPTITVHIEEPIAEQVTREMVLILPTKPEKVIAKCESDRYFEINQSILVKIPETCEIQINEKKFYNDVKITKGKPLILPTTELPIVNNSKVLMTPNIAKINLEEIYKLKDMANQLVPPAGPLYTTTQNETPYIIVGILLTVIVLVIFKYRSKLMKLLRTNRRRKPKKIEDTEPIDSIDLHQFHQSTSKINSVIFDA